VTEAAFLVAIVEPLHDAVERDELHHSELTHDYLPLELDRPAAASVAGRPVDLDHARRRGNRVHAHAGQHRHGQPGAPRQHSEGTGITQTVRNFGASVGLAVLGALLISRNDVNDVNLTGALTKHGVPDPIARHIAGSALSSGAPPGKAQPPALINDVHLAFAHATQTVFYAMAAFLAAAFPSSRSAGSRAGAQRRRCRRRASPRAPPRCARRR
jgi:hypothetical protein